MISGDRSILEGKKSAFYYTLEEFSNHWDRIDVICPRPTPNTQHPNPFSNVYFHPNPRSLWWQECFIRKKGKQLIKKHKHDVMTVHDYPPFYNGAGAMYLGKKTKIPYALEVHHIVGYPKAASLSEWMGRLMSKKYFATASKKATALRTVNQATKDTLSQWGVDANKISVVPSFYLDKELLTSVNKPPVSYDVAFCARLVANKGCSQLLDAIAQLDDARVLIIGDGPERQKLEHQARHLGIEKQVTFLGWLPTKEAVMSAIHTSRLFVMNSSSEGGPRILLEAMGSGMPVIATSVGVVPDVIEDGSNGVITTGEPDDLAQKIQTLLKSHAKRKKLAASATAVLKDFERTKLIKGYADFLKSLV